MHRFSIFHSYLKEFQAFKGWRKKFSAPHHHKQIKLSFSSRPHFRRRMLCKIRWRSLLPSCLKHPKSSSSSSTCSDRKKSAQQSRISFSDLSNPASPISPEDLSLTLIGSNLHVFSVGELREITRNFSSSNFLGEGGFGPVHKGFVDEKVRPGLKAQPVAVKLLDLEGAQGHKEWLVSVIITKMSSTNF